MDSGIINPHEGIFKAYKWSPKEKNNESGIFFIFLYSNWAFYEHFHYLS